MYIAEFVSCLDDINAHHLQIRGAENKVDCCHCLHSDTSGQHDVSSHFKGLVNSDMKINFAAPAEKGLHLLQEFISFR